MDSQKIFIVRLESGENIAQYTSQTAQPMVGDIIHVRYRDRIKPFEIAKTTLKPIIGNYELGVLIVRTPATTAILRAMLHGNQLRDMFVGLFFGFVLIVLPLLKKFRANKKVL